jgi:hypothetical protein
MLDRVLSMLVALSLALLVWMYARSRDQETLDNVAVPVQVVVTAGQAHNYGLEVNGPSRVLVSFTGAPGRIRELQGLLQHNELQIGMTVTVPEEHLRDSRYSETLVVDSTDVHTPPGVAAVLVEDRDRISVTLRRLVERRLPVRFESISEEPIGPVIIEPPTVLVRGPQEILDRVGSIPTQPSELPSRPASGSAQVAAVARVALVGELESRPIQATPARVTVRLPGQPRKVYVLTDLPIRFLCPADFPLRPRFPDERSARLTLRVQGPAQEEPPRAFVYVDLTQGRFLAGANHEPVQVQLPRDFQLAQDPPRVAAFELLPPEGGKGRPAP